MILRRFRQSDVILLVVPSQFLRRVVEDLRTGLQPGTPLVICSKGVNRHAPHDEVVSELGSHPIAVAGPTFAREVAAGLPPQLHSRERNVGQRLIDIIGANGSGRTIRTPHWAEIGGAVKNVLAIACGIVTGKKFGDNARAALITRGLAEMVRLGLAKGAKFETMMGLSGLGDLTLTCNGAQSRNMSLGMALGEGRQLSKILGERRSVAEGVDTSRSMSALAKGLGVEMPICDAINRILHQNENVDDVIRTLLRRPFRAENPKLN